MTGAAQGALIQGAGWPVHLEMIGLSDDRRGVIGAFMIGHTRGCFR